MYNARQLGERFYRACTGKYHISLTITLKEKARSVDGRPTSKKNFEKTD